MTVDPLKVRQVHHNIAILDTEAETMRARGGIHHLLNAELSSASASGMRLALQALDLHNPSEEHV